MRNKSIYIGILVILLLAAGLYYFKSGSKTNTLKKELSNFAVKDTAGITKIFMADRSGKKVTLTRVNSGEWQVNEKFKAKSSAINTLLETIYGITVKQTVPKTAFNTVVKRLASESVKVEIYQNNELTKTYYVGGPTLDFYGTYMILENSSVPYAMWIHGFEGYLTTRYFLEENLWRSNYLFPSSPLDLASIKINYPKNTDLSFELNLLHDAANSKALSFEVKSLKTGKSVNFDENAVKAYLLDIKEISFDNIANKMDPKTKDSTLALPVLHEIWVKDVHGKTTHIKTYPRKGRNGQLDEKGNQLPYDLDRFYGAIDAEPDLFTLQYYVFDKLLKPLNYFER
ncbi:MAG: hypothetical protein IPN99_15800 [Bacteroidetes bacterium]|nr:hypothetical protein [Bacteroidota bacterium]